MNNWEKFFEDKIKKIAQTKSVVDIGGGFKLDKGLKKYKDLFSGCDYEVLDNVEECQPDILGDIHNLPFADNSQEAIICKAVLEHVENPIKATQELFRVLKPGGQCLVYVPFLYSYHAKRDVYKDFYRFTSDGVRYLFRDFSQIEICPVRGRFETIIYLLPIKFLRKILSPIARLFDLLFKNTKQVSGYNVYLIK